jgi:lipid A 3-O-deacylase
MARGMRKPWALALLFPLVLSFQPAAAAQEAAATGGSEAWSRDPLFAHGRYEAALASGVMFSPFLATANRPTVNYSLNTLQFGYMLSDVRGDGWWRGNFEVAGEALASAVFAGPGDYIAGGTVWLRYNFVPRTRWGVVPYAQAGAGMIGTDIDPNLVGQAFNFELGLGVGMRYFLDRNWALSLEYRYQHISNANTGPRNIGINANGPLLGVSFFF